MPPLPFICANIAAMTRHSPLEVKLLPRLQVLGESHGRQLAAALHASPASVARALHRMQTRGLVSSRWVGRTRLYRSSADADLLQRSRRALLAVSDVQFLAVLPFGSRTKGLATSDSDLDLLVVVPDAQATNATWQRLRTALTGIDIPIDLLLYSATEANKWARVPSNPVSEALKANPDFKFQEFLL
jgi:predicted nucleotidyltransferase